MLVCPPILISAFNIVRSRNQDIEKLLFDGDGDMFISLLAQCKVYGEYGVGLSTIYAINNKRKSTLSLDTSETWIHSVGKELKLELKHLWNFKHVYLGPVGDWGYPDTYEYRERFLDYAAELFLFENLPDLVLIDGRFRILCFLQALLNLEQGSKIIFDDFYSTRKYQICETVIKPSKRCGRQALFIVPHNVNKDKINMLIKDFLYIMD
jgi:hypothetical protein